MPVFNTLGTSYDPSGAPVAGLTGATVPTAAVLLGGTDGANLRALLTDNTGKLQATFTASDNTGTGALAALNNNVQVTLTGEASAGFELDAGTLVGTIVPEVSYDGGTNWVGTYFEDPSTGNKSASITFGVANTLQQRSIYTPGGAGLARVRVSAFSSGTATAHLRATTVAYSLRLDQGASGAAAPPVTSQVGGLNAGNLIAIAVDGSGRQIAVGPGATGAAPTGNPVYVAGTDGANLRALLTDATGASVTVGAAANGAAAVGNPVLVAGVDASNNVRRLLTDTTGRLVFINEKAGTATISRTATSTASAILLAANTSRLGAIINNESSHKMYIKFGVTASVTSYTVFLGANSTYELSFDYTGEIDAILDAGSGNAQVTELTP